jgi:DnaJ-class molecular chaperone
LSVPLKPNFYLRLGGHRAMSDDQLRALARPLLREHHPDKGGDVERFKLINEAYTGLCHPLQRFGYDDLLEFVAPRCPGCGGAGVVWKQEGFFKRSGKACVACGGAGFLVNDEEWEIK